MVNVTVQPTPNPNSMKFTLDRRVIERGSKTYASSEAAQESPLAQAIFTVDGVSSVFLLNDFITVTKKPEADWEKIGPAVLQAIQNHFSKEG
ncbi:MAG TPA: NifU N-terminal domain-containing protein [Limnochordia bacterium]